jgi:thiosulfate/3-mercaptopyruvate sulfurtransferase
MTDIEVEPSKGIINSCGTGVSGCILDLALRLLGSTTTRVYDGSWAEYEKTPEPDSIKTIKFE